MPTLRTPLKRGNRRHINQAAVDAWQRGEVWGVHKALNMLPVEFSPVPRRFGGYGLPDQKPADDTLIMVSGWNGTLGWDGVNALQEELYAIAGEPGALANAD